MYKVVLFYTHRTSVSKVLNGQYLKVYFETPSAKNYIGAASAGGTMKHFTLKPSQEMPIKISTMQEQTENWRLL